MTPTPLDKDAPKRILGDLRIFQAIHNDLNLEHDSKNSSYKYKGVDPYELEDSSFPSVLKAINRLIAEARIEEIGSLPPYMFDAYPSLGDRLKALQSKEGEM